VHHPSLQIPAAHFSRPSKIPAFRSRHTVHFWGHHKLIIYIESCNSKGKGAAARPSHRLQRSLSPTSGRLSPPLSLLRLRSKPRSTTPSAPACQPPVEAVPLPPRRAVGSCPQASIGDGFMRARRRHHLKNLNPNSIWGPPSLSAQPPAGAVTMPPLARFTTELPTAAALLLCL
jgi:hypothetical protein